jgi:3-oxoacyl-[acyl-carrier protein] reductase
VALALKADVADREQVAAMVDAAVARFGGIDVLVNNAVRDFRSIAYADLAWDEIQADLDVTLKGAFNCAKLVVPHMLKRGGGKIVNISSIYAENPPPDQLKYVVSKAALEGLARALAAELAGQNIQVNTVVPSFVDTEVSSRMHDALRKRKAQQSPMGRNASPEDVAHAVLFLASSFSSYTTGQRILVTGGGAPYL